VVVVAAAVAPVLEPVLAQAPVWAQELGLEQALALELEPGLVQALALEQEPGLVQASALEQEPGLVQASALEQEPGLELAPGLELELEVLPPVEALRPSPGREQMVHQEWGRYMSWHKAGARP
jgi:hypothetical protein